MSDKDKCNCGSECHCTRDCECGCDHEHGICNCKDGCNCNHDHHDGCGCGSHKCHCKEDPNFINVDRYYSILDDGYERLYTPHRVAYIQGESRPSTGDKESCPFCKSLAKYQENPDETIIIAEGKYVFVIMNLFPYNSGHIMVLPKRHIGYYIELTPEELDEFSRYTQKAIRLLQNVVGAEGYNLGINQGRLAGAGIAAHLHQHIIPRWIGDANFFPLVAKTRTVANPLFQLRDRLRDAWDAA